MYSVESLRVLKTFNWFETSTAYSQVDKEILHFLTMNPTIVHLHNILFCDVMQQVRGR